MATLESGNLFRRIIKPDEGGLNHDLATYVLSLDFEESDKLRFDTLSAKASAGTLTADEESEIDTFLHIDAFMSLLRLKAERVVKGPR